VLHEIGHALGLKHGEENLHIRGSPCRPVQPRILGDEL
jgi:hypothetical protein